MSRDRVSAAPPPLPTTRPPAFSSASSSPNRSSNSSPRSMDPNRSQPSQSVFTTPSPRVQQFSIVRRDTNQQQQPQGNTANREQRSPTQQQQHFQVQQHHQHQQHQQQQQQQQQHHQQPQAYQYQQQQYQQQQQQQQQAQQAQQRFQQQQQQQQQQYQQQQQQQQYQQQQYQDDQQVVDDSYTDSGSSSSEPQVPRRRMSDLIGAKKAEIAAREKKAFTAWGNTWLTKRELKCIELGPDYADGVLLINLLEISFSVSLGKYNLRPKNPMQKLDNVSLAFNYMDSAGMRLLSTDIHDIVAKKEKQIINVLSAILRKLLLQGIGVDSVKGGENQSASTTSVRTNLLAWCQKNFSTIENVNITDFWNSFRDGIAFCAIVDRMVPGKINVSALRKENALENLRLAFTTAETYLGIPALLDPKDFEVEKGDDMMVMNYLAMLISAATAAKTTNAKKEEEIAAVANQFSTEKQQLLEKQMLLEQKMEAAVQAKQQQLENQQQQLDLVSARLTAVLEDATAKSESLNKATENEKKWREATEKWRDSSRKWRESAEKWRASDEKKQNMLKQLQVNHNNEMQNHNNELQKLNAEMYRMHREHEEILERFKEQTISDMTDKRNANPSRPGGGMKGRDVDVASAIRSSRTDLDLLSSMEVKTGFLWRRRPNARFNRFRFKKVYFVLNGDTLDYLREEGGKVKGSFPLRDYHICSILPEDAKQPGDGKELIVRMNSNISDTDNLTLEFKADVYDGQRHQAGMDGVAKEWMEAINIRISLLNYMKKKEAKRGTGWGCPELVHYITDQKSAEIVIQDRLLGIREPLVTLRHALIASQHRLTAIYMGRCELDDPAVEVIADLLRNSSSLISIELPNNKIGPIGAGFLCEGLCVNKTLERLYLDNNQLKDEGVMRLSYAIQNHEKLIDLSLSGNAIGDNGVISLCHALEVSSAHQEKPHEFACFNLAYNLIGDAACAAIADTIEKNPTIKVLILEHNVIADAGVIALASAIEKRDGQIKELYLASNQIGSKGVAALGYTFSVIASELTVDISDNKLVSRAGLAAIVDAKVKIDYMLLKLQKLPGKAGDATASSSGSTTPGGGGAGGSGSWNATPPSSSIGNGSDASANRSSTASSSSLPRSSSARSPGTGASYSHYEQYQRRQTEAGGLLGRVQHDEEDEDREQVRQTEPARRGTAREGDALRNRMQQAEDSDDDD